MIETIPIEPFDFREKTEEIRNRAMFPILEIIPLIQTELEKRVYGAVMVMMSGHGIIIRIRNDAFAFGYELDKCHISDGNIGIVLDDCMYKYQQEILKKYFKQKGGETNA